MLGALGGLGLPVPALVSLAISRVSTFLDYTEPTLRTATVFAATVELATVLVLAAFLLERRRRSDQAATHRA